jgi:AcrR family transcriptional regulator
MANTLTRRRAAHLGPERRRPLVLDAALPLFVEHGYQATSIDMIAEAAGVTRPVIYDCFANKEELFAALVDRESQRLLEDALASLPKDFDPTDSEAMMALGFTAILRAAESHPNSYRLMFDASYLPGGDVAKRLQRGRDRLVAGITQLTLIRFQQSGVKDPERMARLAARLIAGMGEACIRLMLAEPGQWDPDELGAKVAKLAAAAETLF